MPAPPKHPLRLPSVTTGLLLVLLLAAAQLRLSHAAVATRQAAPSSSPEADAPLPSSEATADTEPDCDVLPLNPACIEPGPAEPDTQIVRGPRTECFPAAARATRADGRLVAMRDVRAGDWLRVQGGGSSRVVCMTHADARAVARFVRLEMADGDGLTASGGHFVFVWGGETRRMRDVRVGERMDDGRVVVGKDMRWDIGLFNPQTEAGELVVDGFRVTAYTDALGDGGVAVGHALLAPVRWAVAVAGWTGVAGGAAVGTS